MDHVMTFPLTDCVWAAWCACLPRFGAALLCAASVKVDHHVKHPPPSQRVAPNESCRERQGPAPAPTPGQAPQRAHGGSHVAIARLLRLHDCCIARLLHCSIVAPTPGLRETLAQRPNLGKRKMAP